MTDDHDSFLIKLGEWFEAKAQGRFAIVVLVIVVAALIATKAAALW
jgi:hypothetical protein